MAKMNVVTSGEFSEVIENLNIQGTKLYACPVDDYNDHPYFEIWEIPNTELNNVEEYCVENQIFIYHSRGSNRGTAYDFLTIHGESVIAWQENLTNDSFDCLTDYFLALDIKNAEDMIDYSVYLAKVNGMDLIKFWKQLEG